MLTREQALAEQAEIIRKVREGTPPSWTPKPGWADQFTDEQVWDACRRVAERGGVTPMMVACELVENVIDGKLP